MAQGYFALEFAEKSVRIGDFETKGDALVTISAGLNPLTHDIFTAETDDVVRLTEETLKKLITDTKITKKNVNIIIPDSQSYSRIIEMPLLTEKELVSAIRYQADQFIPIPIDKANIDVEILKEDKVGKKLLVLLVASSKTIINRVISIVEKIGLYPESLETQMSASLRFFEYALTLSAGKNTSTGTVKHILIANIGISTTVIYVFDMLTLLPIASHGFPLGFDFFAKEVKSNHQVDDSQIIDILHNSGFETVNSSVNIAEILTPAYDEFSAEITRYMVSLREKIKIVPDALYLIGEGSKIKGLTTKLAATTGLTTSIFNVIPYMRPNPVVDYFKNDLSLFIPIIGANLRQA